MSLVRPNIAAMQGYVPGEQPQGGKFIKLNTNENPYPMSPAVVRAVQEVLQAGLSRYPDPLATAFRARAAEVLGVDPDWILCGNGSDDILTIVTRAFVGEGDLLRLPYPSYVLYKVLAQLQNAQSEEVEFSADWTLGETFTAARDNLRLAFLPNPNSPSGTFISQEQIAELAERLPCPLLIDEAYVDFAPGHCLDLVKQNPRVMVSRTLSKSYSLAGLRFGFLVAQPDVIRELQKVKDSYNCDSLSIAAATAAIDDQAWLTETTAKIIRTRGRLEASMRELGFDVVPSHANFVWNTHREVPVGDLYRKLKEQGVLVRYMAYRGWPEGLRISVGTDDQIDACVALLKSML